MKFMTNEIKPKIIQNYNSKMFLTKGELVKNCQVFLMKERNPNCKIKCPKQT